ncbi:MAG: hypothetical protein SGARI_004233 [Bacillariaceae sp.]
MSLILRRQIVFGARRPWNASLASLPPSAVTTTINLPSTTQPLQREQRASYWMDVVRVKKGRDGKRRHEDPESVVRRHQEERRSDGQSLLDLESWNDRHEKKWMRRKRLDEKRRYEFDKKHVFDLAKYISFVQENKDK